MKKILFFAFALVASVLALTGCEGNNPNNPIVGTWMYENEPWNGSTDYSRMYAIFNEDFTFELQERWVYSGVEDENFNYMAGTYEFKNGNIVLASFKTHGWYYGNEKTTVPGFEGWDEQIHYSVDGNTLTLIRGYGSSNPETEVYTKQ